MLQMAKVKNTIGRQEKSVVILILQQTDAQKLIQSRLGFLKAFQKLYV